MSKVEVNGPNTIATYKYLRENSSLNGGEIPWNFAKFLVDQRGDVVDYFKP